MAETLVELVARIQTDATGLEKGLTDAERKTEASSKKMSESLKKVGMAMAASGAAITAVMGLMGKAAIDEEINIKRLATTINNSGTAYDSVKDSMEALIATTQRKTGVADDEQRNILNRLILVTNDYKKALELLPTVLDLAAAGEMDATTAATYLGKAYLELEDGAEQVSVRFGQASLQFENMEDVQNRVRGAAENLVNPFSVLKASIGDVAESLGAILIPYIKEGINKLVDVAEKIQSWAKEHPELTKAIIITTTVLGLLMGIVGTAILIIPQLIGMWVAFNTVLHITTIAQWALNVAMSANPIGLIIIAITALIAIIVLMAKNWEDVVNRIKGVWENLKSFFDRIGDFLWKPIEIAINKLLELWDYLKAFWRWLNSLLYPRERGETSPSFALSGAGGAQAAAAYQKSSTGGYLGFMKGYQHGGIVTQPTIALIGEAGAEAVIPLNKAMGNTIINFTQPVFFDREDTMNRFVDKISKTLDRKYRLAFGGAYKGG